MACNRNLLLRCSASVLAVSLSSGAFAQATDQTATGKNAATETEIVVTGSLIRSRDFNSVSPVQTVDSAVIANTGAVSVQDIFKGLTANAGSQQANEQNALQGLSQFSLRGLGVGSTLTLVNGRRAGLSPITDGTGQLFTDSNAFPVNAIERVEVLTDGASATYGSEAVAGVVNVITRKNFEGLELTADARTSVVDAYQAGLAFGHRFDRGRVSIFANWRKQSGAFRSQIPIIKQLDSANAAGIGALYISGTSAPGRISRAVPSGTTYVLGTTLADPDCVAGGGILTAATTCSYPFIDQRRVIPKEQRIQLLAQFDYELTDALKVFGEISYSRNEIRDAIGGTVLNKTQVAGGFLVPASHPFNYFVANGATGLRYAGPAEFAANPTLQAVPVIFRGRPIGAAGDGAAAPDLVTTFNNLRLVGGFDYDLGKGLILSGSYTYAENSYRRSQPHDFDSGLFQQALLNGTFNPFGTAISNPTLVGRDGRSLAANTEAALGTFSFTINDTGKTVQQTAELILSGDSGINLPGGQISFALGGQFRSVGFENIPDGRRQSGANGRDEIEPAIPFTTQKVFAAFGEIALPVLDRFNISAALRYENYGSKGGSTVDPKVSGKFDLTDFLSIRGSYGTSFQAPSIRQVAGTVSNSSVNDPPNAGSFNVTVFTSGSANLKSQTASNLNLGLVLNTRFGLKMSVDYFTYNYKNLILPEGDPQFIVDEVRAGRLPASRVVRDGAGQLRQVFTQFLNRGDASASGIDINLRYSPKWFASTDVTFDATSTIITRFRSTDFAGLDGSGDLKGSRNFANAFGSVPDFKVNAGVTVQHGLHSVNVSGRYIGAYIDDQTKLPINSQLTIDARYTLSLDKFLGGEGTSLTVGAINLFNVNPPALTVRPGYDNEVHDIRGRQLYVSLKHKF
ncbi:TonB-dependent siderophore receptor [Sphingomonas sp. SUN039]|uniref:TonB-dependent receptor plug domain-containing protein n=1 Tax=Sphingomonas sp. SUN039 TaxID=2937787 RepID=UPI0021643B7B|nr:TonB-dependent receptor [Sphingomonas sp. SUN039]UVO54578.1 TonB-dependent receptor [Sphingomonas sp. SUN039]